MRAGHKRPSPMNSINHENVAMKLKTPEADDKSEMAGRMYEACDLQIAIENGHLQTVEEILAWVKETSTGLQALMELPVWVVTENACIDIKASIEHNRNAGLNMNQKL
ncbi:hypothetical protein ALP52_200051 [Pseudomonas amygdali pv. mori]|uniref:Uncharacterized protein n=3 Tax=Pseudomonas amygdali TaxID=47877 RepID=A0A3M5JNK5_PSEA0|nr:hypothetical protein ALP52_200051 [Pseudomonas amygdali pv. mori]